MNVWLNGELLDVEAARIDPRDRGLLLGDGIFETVCVRAKEAKRLNRHLDRLTHGARVLAIPIRWEREVLMRAVQSVIDANVIANGVLRMTLTRGPGPRGPMPDRDAMPTLQITATAAEPNMAPLRAITATRTRRNEFSPLSKIKNINYGDAIVALLEARDAGVDEAILLNTQGKYAEACMHNLYLVVDGKIVTPRVADGALPGVQRAALMDAGLVADATVGIDEMQRASEVFLSNALGIRSLVSLDGQTIGNGEPGPETQRLQAVADTL